MQTFIWTFSQRTNVCKWLQPLFGRPKCQVRFSGSQLLWICYTNLGIPFLGKISKRSSQSTSHYELSNMQLKPVFNGWNHIQFMSTSAQALPALVQKKFFQVCAKKCATSSLICTWAASWFTSWAGITARTIFTLNDYAEPKITNIWSLEKCSCYTT